MNSDIDLAHARAGENKSGAHYSDARWLAVVDRLAREHRRDHAMSHSTKARAKRKPFQCWAVLAMKGDGSGEWFLFHGGFKTKRLAQGCAAASMRVVRLREAS